MSYDLFVHRGIAILFAVLAGMVFVLFIIVSIPLAVIGAIATFVHWVFTHGDPLVP
jgi:hypothetical protein